MTLERPLAASLLPAAFFCAFLFALAPVIAAQETPPAHGPQSLRQNSSLDLSSLDRSADPCVDFYQFSCGGWLKNHPIPPDQASWGRFNELAERNRAELRAILEDAAAAKNRTPNEQKIGDYFASCMDETAINQKGIAVLQPELERIETLGSKSALPSLVAHLHEEGVEVLFGFSSGADFQNARENIGQADQGGLSLPERDYYFKDDPKSVALRKAFLQHVANMFKLLGDDPDKAAAEARAVLTLETALAKGALEPEDRRDPDKVYHKVSLAEWQAIAPGFSWSRYLADVGAPPLTSLNLAVPDFFKALDAELKDVRLDDLKTYLRWRLVHSQAQFLPAAFVNEDFGFFGKTLTGAKELRPRWKRCVSAVDSDLGEALGQVYVQKYFPPEAKARTLQMVQALEAALRQDITGLPWMTDATKQQALVKLAAIQNKIGYPDHWRDYSSLEIVRGDALGNSLRSNAFEVRRQLNKIGKPVDRQEWDMTPPTVNAYYDPTENNINFPAGILQPPFFDFKADDAVNFGGIGAVIGHEMTHGFDDEGRQFDADGNLHDWWTAADAKAFDQRAQCLVDEYGSFTAVDDVKLNGKLTLGENTADNGGLRLAYIALMATLSEESAPPKIDGFTPAQRLFLNFGQIWCTNQTEQIERLRALGDPHSLPKYRVNGVVRNMPEFRETWNCKEGQPMAPESACRVW